MWGFIDRLVEIVSNSNKGIKAKDMCGFWIEINGRIRAKEQ